ncbi:hypothetical protein ACNI3K_00995 [Demequina sp. SO4-13]|uniref:hypothetical protein n=1 Tax=Demequina sp. SO4-13 TaxID=3401027 RepID=UPI003AF6F8BE
MIIRRTLAIGAIAGLSLAAPTAAMATYPAPEAELTCATSQTAPGDSFACTSTGADGDEHQLQATTAGEDASIAGTVTSQVKVVDGGSVSWTVTPPSDQGTVGLSLIVNGVATDTATVVVAEGGDTGDGVGAGTEDGLAATGFDNMGLLVGAGALVVVGGGAAAFAVRRRSNQSV